VACKTDIETTALPLGAPLGICYHQNFPPVMYVH